MSRRAWVLFALMGVIWGIPYLLIKVSVASLSPATLVMLRTAAGAALLLPVALARGEVRPLLARWRWVLLYTLVELGFTWFLLSDAETRLSSSLSGLLVATVPLVGAVIGIAGRASDRMRLRQVAGLAVGLAGVAALVGLDISRLDPRALGEIALVVLGYALGPLIVSRRLGEVPALGVVAVSLVLTALAYAPAGILQRPASVPGPEVIAAVAVLAVVCTAAAFLVFFALIAEAGPVRATIITYVNPAVALVLGIVLLHEPLTAGAVVGLALIVAGSYLSTRPVAGGSPARTDVAEPAAAPS
ncbi:MAG: DMT family transporter [Candidatus Dormibacteraeota bacterium]|nr:DMT family transporter [Candidatus Dormibacteraeota bacterium]MBV8446324.1 DMT family transporter [Candidatus Dormibacteraeota bacterium]